MSAKGLLALGLAPLAGAAHDLGPRLRRLWAYAGLCAALPRRPDPSVVIEGLPEVHGTARIALGRELYLYRDLYLETRAAGEIVIGDRCVLSRGVHIVAHCGVTIGAGTMIGEYTSVRDANHVHGPGIAPREAGFAARAIAIGRDVWIGRGVAILPGVTIGDGAVVGANAVVSKDVPAGAVVAGVPAHPLHPRSTRTPC